MSKWLIVTVAVFTGFGVGTVVSQAQTPTVSMRGIVKDANTLPEEVEYWEVRTPSGESIVVSGRRELPVVRWLRQARGRTIVLTVEPSK